MHRFKDKKFSKDTISIGPGEFHISSEDIIIQTVLGSCVAVCLYSDYNDFVAMNHFMLPGDIAKSHIADTDAGRYGMFSMELVINGLLKKGIKKNTIKAKVFGGGNVLTLNNVKSRVGDNNVLFVKEFLEQENIPIVSSHVGGVNARKILFFTRSKEVLLKKIAKSQAISTVEEEKRYSEKIEKKEKEHTNIIMFD